MNWGILKFFSVSGMKFCAHFFTQGTFTAMFFRFNVSM